MSVTMFVKHQVNSFDDWKKVYDEFGASSRKQMGVMGASVHRDASQPDTLTITHQFANLEAATAFANSDELKSAMRRAGVTSQPEIWFTEDVERTAF